MGAVVLQRGEPEKNGERPREQGAARRLQPGVLPRVQRAAPARVITEITDDDYRSVWRPCEALEEDPPPP
tara:strand:+ start:6110 stop:6319 length:210 start_codon:yes stop_codon:yes gene_type:complete